MTHGQNHFKFINLDYTVWS